MLTPLRFQTESSWANCWPEGEPCRSGTTGTVTVRLTVLGSAQFIGTLHKKSCASVGIEQTSHIRRSCRERG